MTSPSLPPDVRALTKLLRAMAEGTIYREAKHDVILTEAAAMLERLALREQWRTDMENAPRDGTDILLGWTWDSHVEQGHWRQTPGDGCWYGYVSGYFAAKNNPDRWHPLPSLPTPPKEGETDG